MMGIYLQRSWIIDLITLTILLPVFIFGAQIFSLLGKEQGIAKSGGYISVWFIPYVYGLIFSLTIQMYLQAQQKNMIIEWLSTLQFVIHILCLWLFVYVLEFGVAGAMAALHIFMVSCFGRICVHLRGLVPRHVERIQCSCSEGLMARGEALCFIWFDDLVSNTSARLQRWHLDSSDKEKSCVHD